MESSPSTSMATDLLISWPLATTMAMKCCQAVMMRWKVLFCWEKAEENSPPVRPARAVSLYPAMPEHWLACGHQTANCSSHRKILIACGYSGKQAQRTTRMYFIPDQATGVRK